MRVLQGAVIVVGIVQVVVGYTGLFCPILKYIGPVTIAPVVSVIGLALFGIGWNNIATCWSIGLTQLFTTIIFSQYLKRVQLFKVPVFALFPIIMAITFTWSLAAILTGALRACVLT
jgi:nucleobase transporter 1/2